MEAPGKTHRRKNLVLLASFVAVTLTALYLVFFREEGRAVYIETTGIMEATEVELSPKISGRINWLCCSEGDGVKKGDIAIRLDDAEPRARKEEGEAALRAAGDAVREARISLDNSKARAESRRFEKDAASAEVARREALLADAATNLERAEGLFREGFVPKKDLDAARTRFDEALAELDSAKARELAAEAVLRTSEVEIKAAAARVRTSESAYAQAGARLKVLEEELKDTAIASPITGNVVYKAFEEGETVNPGEAVYTLHDLGNLWARVDIEETALEKVVLGARAEVTPPGSGEAYEGTVIEIGRQGEFATLKDVTRGRSDIRTFRVKVKVHDPAGRLRPGMTVRVRVFSGKAPGAD